MVSKAFKLAEAMVSNPVMSDMVANPTETPTKIAAVETKTAKISASGEISAKNITTNNTLTQSFDSNQTITFNLTDSINSVSPIVSVFKEVPQPGVSSKGNWDVNANATNYEFFDEKPISYSSVNLTPSATGDGTFTSSNPVVSGYDFTNFAYDNVTASTGISGNNEEIRFNNDGTKLYILSDNGPNGDGVYQFSLSTAYDISTLSYDSVYYNSTQGSSVRDIQFNADGTKMFILHSNTKTIYRYSLSTAFNVGTASYDNVSLLVNYAAANAPMGFFFNGDATKLYLIWAGGSNSGDSTIYERQLPGAYDISSATAVSTFLYNEPDLPAGTTEAYASSGLFNNDGTKMYLNIQRMPILSNTAIIEYDLSTAYDLTTISRTSIQYLTTGTGNPGAGPRGMAWNGDGTKLITLNEAGNLFRFTSSGSTVFSSSDVGKKVVGNSGSAVITATSGTYKSVTPFADTSAISSWQLYGAEGKSDGTGISLTAVGGGYDLSNASYDSKSLDVNAYESTARAVDISSDGLHLIMCGSFVDDLHYFTLSTAFDVSTATYVNKIDPHGITLAGCRFSSTGHKVFTCDANTYKVESFDLSTAYDLSTAGTGTTSTALTTVSSNAQTGLFDFNFNNDGTKLFALDRNAYKIHEYTLSTAWDITNLTYVDAYTHTAYSEAFAFNDDGTKLFILNVSGNDKVELHNLSVAFDISTASISSPLVSFDTFEQDNNSWGLCFGNSGQKMYVVGSDGNDTIYQYSTGSISHPYSQYFPALTNSSNGQINSSSWLDINSMTADETKNDGDIFYAVSTDNRTSWGVAKGSDGVRKIARNNSGTWQYNNNAGTSVTTYYDISNASENLNETFTQTYSIAAGFTFNDDGTKLYVSHTNSATAGFNRVQEYNLSTAYDVSTASTTFTTFNTNTKNLHSIQFNDDGTKFYAMYTGNSDLNECVVREYNLTTAYDLSTLNTSAAASLTITGPDGSGITAYYRSFLWSSDGTKAYIIARDSRIVRQWEFTTAYDVSTGSYNSNYFDINAQLASSYNLNGIAFNANGTKMIVSVSTAGLIEYNLSTPWDVTTATYSNVTISMGTPASQNIGFSGDGSKVYIGHNVSGIGAIKTLSSSGTTIGYGTSETWVNGTNNDEHATLQQALTSQSFNRMNKAQLDTVADGYHFSQDSADTLDLMIAPYAASGASPVSDGVTINYDAEALVREAVAGTDYIAEFPSPSRIDIKSLINGNLKIRAQ